MPVSTVSHRSLGTGVGSIRRRVTAPGWESGARSGGNPEQLRHTDRIGGTARKSSVTIAALIRPPIRRCRFHLTPRCRSSSGSGLVPATGSESWSGGFPWRLSASRIGIGSLLRRSTRPSAVPFPNFPPLAPSSPIIVGGRSHDPPPALDAQRMRAPSGSIIDYRHATSHSRLREIRRPAVDRHAPVSSRRWEGDDGDRVRHRRDRHRWRRPASPSPHEVTNAAGRPSGFVHRDDRSLRSVLEVVRSAA